MRNFGSSTIWIVSTLFLLFAQNFLAENLTDPTDVLNGISVSTCTTEACISAAKYIKANMNRTVDPCDDFYQFACGGYIADNKILDNETETSTFEDLVKKAKFIREDLLASSKDSAFDSERKAKQLYKQCADRESIEKEKGIPLLRFLDSVLGGWPLVKSDWNASNFDLLSILIVNRAYLNEPLFSMDVSANLWNPSVNNIEFDEPDTSIEKDVLTSEVRQLQLESYTKLIKDITHLLEKDSGQQSLEKDKEEMIQDIVALGNSITLSKLTAVESRSMTKYKNMTLGAFQKTIFSRSNFGKDLLTYAQETMKVVGLSQMVNQTTIVTVDSLQYFSALDGILFNLELEKDVGKRKIANYIGWKIIEDSIQYLSKEYRDAKSAHLQRIQGQIDIPQTATAERCTRHVLAVLPVAVGATYVREVVPEKLKIQATEMINDIHDGFRQLLINANWMDNVTMAFALHKLDQMMKLIAYSDTLIKNVSAIDEYYHRLEIKTSFFETMLAAMEFENLDNLERIAKTNPRFDPIRNYADITTVNAYYEPNRNMLVILAAILREPFFSFEYPKYLNYGKIGFVVGHETTHGFDDQGSQFDDRGLMRGWWSNQTFDLYLERAKTLRYQYGNFSLPEGNVNGDLTLGENIADNGGAKAAYRAYELFQSRLTKPEPLLPGFENFTVHQMFFLAGGQLWCEKIRSKTQQVDLLTNEHSPGRFRVVGPFSNMPEFSAAFKCSANSRMNLVHKNGVW